MASVEYLGGHLIGVIEHIGSLLLLLLSVCRWILRTISNRNERLGHYAIVTQLVRIGVKSILIVSLISGAVGAILVLQMSPPLEKFGSKELVANILGVAIFRELGPLMAAIVLTGFAGAAIAAEIGTMVVGEEIEALQAHALNPVRFLVVPRVIAACASMLCLAVLANLVAVTAGLGVSVIVLDIPASSFMKNLLNESTGVSLVDFLTGIAKAGVFGLLIGVIACGNGLKVQGGAEGVGQATTGTVVQSIVSIVIADLFFTAVFYVLGLV